MDLNSEYAQEQMEAIGKLILENIGEEAFSRMSTEMKLQAITHATEQNHLHNLENFDKIDNMNHEEREAMLGLS